MHEQKAELAPEQRVFADRPANDTEPSNHGPKLVKVANFRFQVVDADESLKQINRIVARYPAYVADSRMSVTAAHIEHSLTIKIPPEHFDRFLSDVDSQSIFTEFRNVQQRMYRKSSWTWSRG